MRKQELLKKLKEIKSLGFVRSTRKGSTGVGYTFERLLGIRENNIAIPDIGGRVEIKTKRSSHNSLITLFTFNKGVWKVELRELIEKYGYTDEKHRKALKTTLYFGHINERTGLTLNIKEDVNALEIRDTNNSLLGVYSLYVVVGKFFTKLGIVLFVVADSKEEEGSEYFHYKDFYLCSEPALERFIKGIKTGSVAIDLRMHIKDNGSIRNRGTAFRVRESSLPELYNRVEKLEV